MANRMTVLVLMLLMPCHGARAAQTPGEASQFFGVANVWELHLTVTAEDWKAMQPKQQARGGGGPGDGPGGPGGQRGPGPGGPPPKNEYPWVHATLQLNDLVVKDVGLRFKGNSSFRAPGPGLKHPFKLDFNRFVDGQKFLGLAQLNLSNNAMDPSQSREALAYSVFRASGVPSSRTAFVKIYLTVNGQMDHQYLGLYTAVEDVGKSFLKAHFDSGKGMLLKPEGARDFPYHGEEWASYKGRLNPHREPMAEQSARFIAFSKLINNSDDAEFRSRIAEFLDVDGFLRFIAVNGALANMDSYLCTGHNFYLYLSPKTDKFAFIPWDLNEAFAGFQMPGNADLQAELSIRHPHTGVNRLIERTLAIAEYDAAYRKDLQALISGPLSAESIDGQLRTIEAACKPAIDAERSAGISRAEPPRPRPNGPPGGGPMMNKPDVRQWMVRRVASMVSQLAGESSGRILEMRRGFGPPNGGPGANPRPGEPREPRP